ncbi:MAG TPA: ABC transporter permease [Aestuariivirgaceae bacterium]|nr:ABC transporter permease [Aestuariivirgaceae bacterium]
MSQAIRIVYLLKGVWAVLAALLVGSILMLIAGSDPIAAYSALFHGAFFDYWGFATTLVKTCPLLLAGLAVVLPLRAGLFNIGAEGQIYMGALFGTMAALYVPELPGPLHILLATLAGAIGGALWALLPALLKAYQRINEIIVTLLMNFVALHFVSFMVSGPMMEPGAPYPYSPEIPSALFLPHILPRTDAHLGVVVAIILAILLYGVLRRGVPGYTLDTIGQNPDAARYAGMSVERHVIVSFLVAGAFAGLAGIFEVLGLRHRLFHAFSQGYGYDGIVVAFLAGLNPLLAIVSAVFIAGLRSGANIMQRAVGVPVTVIEAIQGLVILFVATSLAFRYREGALGRLIAKRAEIDTELDQAKADRAPQ